MSNKLTICVSVLIFSCLILLLSIINDDFKSKNDPYEYAHIGKNVWMGEGIQFNGVPDVVLPPGFPVVVGAIANVIGSLEWSGKIISIASFLLSLFFLYKVSLFFLEIKYSILPVLLFSTNSNVLINATNGYSESLFTVIFLALAWITLNHKLRHSLELRHTMLFSVLWAILYYVRPEGLIIGAILFCWLMVGSISNKWILWLMPIMCAILIFPYIFFLKSYTGQWQLSGKTYLNLVMGELNSPYQTKIQDTPPDPRYDITSRTLAEPLWAHGLMRYLKQPENDIIQRIPINIMRWSRIYWLTFSFAGIILWVWGMLKLSRRDTLFLLSLLATGAIYLIFFILPRSVAIYHWVPVLFIVSGLKHFKQYAERKFPRGFADKLLWTAILFISLYQVRAVVKIIYHFIS